MLNSHDLLYSQIKTSDLIGQLAVRPKPYWTAKKAYWTEKSKAYFNQQTKKTAKTFKQVLAF